jgi:hypothetical protein
MLDTSFMLFHIIAFHVLKGFKIYYNTFGVNIIQFLVKVNSLSKNVMNMWCECSSIANRYYVMNG